MPGGGARAGDGRGLGTPREVDASSAQQQEEDTEVVPAISLYRIGGADVRAVLVRAAPFIPWPSLIKTTSSRAAGLRVVAIDCARDGLSGERHGQQEEYARNKKEAGKGSRDT